MVYQDEILLHHYYFADESIKVACSFTPKSREMVILRVILLVYDLVKLIPFWGLKGSHTQPLCLKWDHVFIFSFFYFLVSVIPPLSALLKTALSAH